MLMLQKKYLPILKNILLKFNIKIIEIILPSGEKNKDLKVILLYFDSEDKITEYSNYQ